MVYVDTTDDELNEAQARGEVPACSRIKKDSFYWYSNLIKSNGVNWGGEITHGC